MGTPAEDVLDIRPAGFPGDRDQVCRLFLDYAHSLEFSLAFQGFDAELASLPGDYAPPAGRLLLARRQVDAVGCVALRPLEGDTCEMKRLYVTPAGRGSGVGHALAERICDEARQAGYHRIRLDTVPDMGSARRIYESLEFRRIAPYCFNPVPGAIFMELDLRRNASAG